MTTAPPAPARPYSLRRRLLWLLLAAISVAVLIQTATAYRLLLRETDAIFDQQMQQIAVSMLGGFSAPGRPRLLPGATGAGPDLLIQVWVVDGELVYESRPGIRPPPSVVLGFSNGESAGTPLRMYTLQAGDRIVWVAQDQSVRRALARQLALRAVWPVALLAPLLMAAVWWVVTRSLAPITRTRAQVAARAADDLSPLSEQDLPDEVTTLVQELNLLFERLRRAIDAQAAFVADAAHELRSPLAALRLQAQGLERAASDADRRVAAQRLASGIDRATRLVEQMLALARQEAIVAAPVDAAAADLCALAADAVVEQATQARNRGIDLGVHRAEPVTVAGDAAALGILLRNLVDNAIRHTPAGGTVDVSVEAGPAPALRVEDSGPGIAPADRERAFDRFFRAAGGEPAGSGLGLAIVRSIAERHGARVLLEDSPRLGGLCARVVFDAARRAPAGLSQA